MGRAEVGTPKYLANKMKSKGLQKLRWYCQMCQKQCRDENGFKCHTMSESHQRQLLLFSDNSSRIINDFSAEFAKGYMDIVRRQFGTKRVAANKVYQEYIADKNHCHMNSTRWTTLKGFVLWLGKTGQCVVDETEKGWFVTYIDRDPETLARQEKLTKKRKMDKDDDERLRDFIDKQVKRGKKEEQGTTVEGDQGQADVEFKRNHEEEKIKLSLNLTSVPRKAETIAPIFKQPFPAKSKRGDHENTSKEEGRRLTALDEIIRATELRKEKDNRKDYWLAEGIVVKVVTKSLGEKFYKAKGVVRKVIDKYRGEVKLLETGEKFKLDQAHVETVIPQIGKEVLILNGAYRGSTAILKELDEKHFCVNLEICRGPLKGRILNKIQYEDISKLYDS